MVSPAVRAFSTCGSFSVRNFGVFATRRSNKHYCTHARRMWVYAQTPWCMRWLSSAAPPVAWHTSVAESRHRGVFKGRLQCCWGWVVGVGGHGQRTDDPESLAATLRCIWALYCKDTHTPSMIHGLIALGVCLLRVPCYFFYLQGNITRRMIPLNPTTQRIFTTQAVLRIETSTTEHARLRQYQACAHSARSLTWLCQ